MKSFFLSIAFALLVVGFAATDASAQDVAMNPDLTGVYQVRTPNEGNWFVTYTKMANWVKFTLSKSGQVSRVWQVWTPTDGPNGPTSGRIHYSIGGNLKLIVEFEENVIVTTTTPTTTFTFEEALANPALFNGSAISALRPYIEHDRPILNVLINVIPGASLLGAGPFYTTGEMEHQSYSSLAATGYWTQVEWVPPGTDPTTNFTFGGCIFWCRLTSMDCTPGESRCVGDCERQWNQKAIDWRTDCGVPIFLPPGVF